MGTISTSTVVTATIERIWEAGEDVGGDFQWIDSLWSEQLLQLVTHAVRDRIASELPADKREKFTSLVDQYGFVAARAWLPQIGYLDYSRAMSEAQATVTFAAAAEFIALMRDAGSTAATIQESAAS